MALNGTEKELEQKKSEEKELNQAFTGNCSISSSSNVKTKDLHLLLTYTGAYAYAAIISLALRELFDNKWDKVFNLECISAFLKRLNLPKKVKPVMIGLLDGHGSQSSDCYISLLSEEPAISGKPALLIEDLLHFAVSEGKYDARMRVLIQHLCSLFDIPLDILDFYEHSVVQFLNDKAEEVNIEEEQQKVKREKNKKIKRYALIGLGALGGGAVFALTGGLAAPLLVAGIETVLGVGSIAVLSSTAGAALIGSLFGVAGAGLTGYKMKKRVGAVEEFAFCVLTKNPTLNSDMHITIAISGWLSDEAPNNFRQPWRNLLHSREQYYLRYETRYLLELGNAVNYISNFAVSTAAQEALKHTVLSGIIAAVAWPASLMTLANIIDNPWGVCCRRSAEVGKQLAEVLLSREQGQRPVTLIGYSLGARVIYYCLREMSNRENCEGIIQDAILLGTPVTASAECWNQLTRVVSGRLINGYSKGDWLLKFLYRTLSMAKGVAGLQPINSSDKRIVNVNLTDVVSGHSDYSRKIGSILKLINVRTINDVPMDFNLLMKKSSSEISNLAKKSSSSLATLKSFHSDESMQVKR